MKKKSLEMLNLINEFLQDRITAEEFDEQFSISFFKNRDLLKKELSKEHYEVLEDLDIDFGYFEPHPKIRKECKDYFDEKVLRKKAKNVFDKLKKEKLEGE